MGKTRFESSVKQIPYPQQAVYDMLSNLENISKVMDRIPADKIKDISFDRDHVSMSVDPVGAIKLAVCEREEPKCIKFQTEKSPVPFYVWIQMLPVTDTTSKMRITAGRPQSVYQDVGAETPPGWSGANRRWLGADTI